MILFSIEGNPFITRFKTEDKFFIVDVFNYAY